MSALGDFPGGPVPPMQRVQVPSLVEKLSSYKLHGQKKPKKMSTLRENTVSPLYPQVPQIWPIKDRKYSGEKKKPRKFQKAKLLLHQKLLHSIYIILGITSNLEMSSNVWEDVCRLYANILSFFIRNLRSRTNPPWLWRHNCNFKNEKAYTWYFLWYTIVLNAKTKQNILSCRYISYHPK